ncbi:3-keto-disaccharide hydrolase [Sphingobacterium sp. Mn56C]|uniref:3-keto-disaccharide hydrolase n=1 Tax=Sphingobacterium sp. Mn56C TaxID=3395261 RepID=UPI003BD80745
MKNKTAYKNKLMDKKYSDGSWHLRAARNFIALGLTSLLVGAIPFVVQAQKGWHHLFDGKSLSGWKIVGKDADFKVEEGLIVGTMKKGLPNAFLVTEKEYGDFVLEVEFKLEGNTTNSGVQVRSHIDPEGNKGYGRVFGPQVEIDPTPRSWTGGLYDEGRRGWIYPLDLNEKAKSAYKLEEFNTLRIEALGAELRSWVNGVPASHFIDTMRREGIIALQIHSIPDELDGKRVFFRQVRIQTGKFKASPLNPDVYVVNVQPNVLSETEKKAGYNLLFDGNSVGQWRSVKGPDFPDRGWKVSDGALQVLKADGGESTNGGDIITKDRYAVFDLSFEFKLTPGANSGVKYFVTLKEQTQGSAIGLEYQILDDATHPDAKLGRAGNRTLASLYDLITSNREERARRPIGQWNRGRIVVTADNQVFHYLNGMLMLQYKRGSKEFKDLVALSKYKDWEAFGEAATGHILLQDHGDAVSFRSIKVKKIK